MSKVNAEVLAMSESLKAELQGKLVKGTPLDPEIASSLFTKIMPEDLPKAAVDAYEHTRGVFFPAVSKAVAEVLQPQMAKDDTFLNYETTIPLPGNNSFTINVERSRTYPGIGDAPATTKYGVITAKLETGAVVSSRGQMKAVYDQTKADYAEALNPSK